MRFARLQPDRRTSSGVVESTFAEYHVDHWTGPVSTINLWKTKAHDLPITLTDWTHFEFDAAQAATPVLSVFGIINTLYVCTQKPK